MKYLSIPNVLTLLRIIFATGLLFVDYHSVIFIIGYLVCGLTDVLDGFIARKMKSETAFGAKLDSIADLFMFLLVTVTIVKQIQINKYMVIAVITVLAIRMANGLISKVKFKKISSIHTIANKITGVTLFFCPIAYPYTGNAVLITAGILAVVSAVEESLIFLTSKTIDLNRKSIFTK